MTNYSFPYFAGLDAENLNDYYTSELNLNSQNVIITASFNKASIGIERLKFIQHFLDNIINLDIQNKKYINENYLHHDSGPVKTYIEHHLEEIGSKELTHLLGLNNNDVSVDLQLINYVHLLKVQLYPDGQNQFAIFDYSLGSEITPYLIVINTDEDGNLIHMSMES